MKNSISLIAFLSISPVLPTRQSSSPGGGNAISIDEFAKKDDARQLKKL